MVCGHSSRRPCRQGLTLILKDKEESLVRKREREAVKWTRSVLQEVEVESEGRKRGKFRGKKESCGREVLGVV